MMVVKNALPYAAIVPTFVLYAQDCAREIPSIQKIFVLYVPRFVKLALKNALNMLLITKAVKLVRKLVRNAQKHVHSHIDQFKLETVIMKTKKTITTLFASLLMMVLCFTTVNASAQSKKKSEKTKECCMMKDGKMMHCKDGVCMPMEKDMTMKNGTVCMVNGECVMKDGKKTSMKEGECMDMNGKMDKCKKPDSKATAYTCSMHPEVTSEKSGKCPKCGMELTKK